MADYIDEMINDEIKLLRKQLQAEKQKSKHLEDCLNQALKDLEEEQIKVKELEEELTLAKKEVCQKCDFQKTYFDNTKKLMKEKQQYKQALEEIKTFIQKIEDNGCAYGDYDCENCSDLQEDNVCTHKIIKLILQKCEVLDDAL